jgi:hypothetical protein
MTAQPHVTTHDRSEALLSELAKLVVSSTRPREPMAGPRFVHHETESLLHQVVHAAATAADLADIPKGWCLTAAPVTVAVLEHLGMSGARVLGVDVAFFGREAWSLYQARIPTELWPDTAYSVGTGGTDRADGGWDGHAVAYLPSKAGGGTAWILDPSAGQFSSQDHLQVGPLAVPVPTTFLAAEPMDVPLGHGGMVVRRNPRLMRQSAVLSERWSGIDELVQDTLSLLGRTGDRARGVLK